MLYWCYARYVVALFDCNYGCEFVFRFVFVVFGCCAFGWVVGFAVLRLG